jgi:phospholipid/cholesterol/gamma-HCH transport system substrate-binding protein
MKRRDEVLVGIFTTVAVVVAVLGSIWFVRGGISAGYPLYSRFAWGSGLKQGQPVWLSGVNVGFVDDVQFDPSGTIVVQYRIKKHFAVPLGTTAQIVPNGFFGDVAIALTPTTPNARTFASGDTVPVGAPQAGIALLTARADTISAGVNDLLGNVRQQLIDSGGVRELRLTLAAANRLVGQLAQVVALQSTELQSTMATIRTRAAAVDSAQVDSTVRALHATSQNLADVTHELRATGDRMNAILAKVESGDGSAAKLINDPALYNGLVRLLLRVDSLTVDFKKNPRRFINLEIF